MTAKELRKKTALWLRPAPMGVVLAAALALTPAAPVQADESEWSIARVWNEELLEAIRNDSARPPVHARNLYHVSAAMYDAWTVYDSESQGVFVTEKVPTDDVEAARHEAISYAAYRVLEHRFVNSPGADITLPAIEARMNMLGYDTSITTTIGDSPAAVGNRIAQAIIDHGYEDGSNEAENYAGIDPHTGEPYEPLNEPLIIEEPGAPTMVHPNNWQEIFLNVQIDQQGNLIDGNTVPFVGPHWGFVTAFSLREEHLTPGKPGVYLDPGPPPQLGESPEDTELWLDTFTDVLITASVLDPDLGQFIDVSPAVFGNNPLGENTNPGHGSTNPVTGEPYEPNVVNYGDYGRIIAEFWADGPRSSTPPGHWNEIANEFVADHPDFHFQLGGEGPSLDRLEWDVKMYLAINGAAHDAAVACWGVKGFYDFVRPVSAIRYMADRGQSTDPRLPNYHPHGLPLIEGLIELITEETIAPGGKHEHLAEMLVDEDGEPIEGDDGLFIWDAEQFIGEVAVKGWPGPAAVIDDFGEEMLDPLAPSPFGLPNIWIHSDYWIQPGGYSGVKWIRGKRWTTYQESTFITPPFAGYTSGHTTFSRAIAEVLTEITGSHYFPGGLAEYHIPEGDGLDFEHGPSEDVTLQWTSYYDCSDQSARSRIYGGIHPYVDDIPARFHGHQIGLIVAEQALDQFTGQAFIPCPADFTGDSVVDVFDLLLMIRTWGPCPEGGSCPADITGSGDVNVLDLLELIDNWGSCPD